MRTISFINIIRFLSLSLYFGFLTDDDAARGPPRTAVPAERVADEGDGPGAAIVGGRAAGRVRPVRRPGGHVRGVRVPDAGVRRVRVQRGVRSGRR